jgi:hypothetical protein
LARFQKYSGVLLGAGGHMHDYGQQLTLEDSGAKVSSPCSLRKTDAQGHLSLDPGRHFFQTGGFAFAADDKLTVSASWHNNPTGNFSTAALHGHCAGYCPARSRALNNSAIPLPHLPWHTLPTYNH